MTIAAPLLLLTFFLGALGLFLLLLLGSSSLKKRLPSLQIDSVEKTAAGFVAAVAIGLSSYAYFIEELYYRRAVYFDVRCTVRNTEQGPEQALRIFYLSEKPITKCSVFIRPSVRNRKGEDISYSARSGEPRSQDFDCLPASKVDYAYEVSLPNLVRRSYAELTEKWVDEGPLVVTALKQVTIHYELPTGESAEFERRSIECPREEPSRSSWYQSSSPVTTSY